MLAAEVVFASARSQLTTRPEAFIGEGSSKWRISGEKHGLMTLVPRPRHTR